MRWIVSLTVVLMACGGPQIPAHNGYKAKEAKPWNKPKVLKFDDKQEFKADGDVSYPDMRRARWYQVETPSNGQLALTVEITPPGDAVNDDFDLGFEVLDPNYRVIAKSDLEDGDAHELTKKKTLVDLAPAKYLVHIYLQGRMDTSDFVLRGAFKPTAPAEIKSNFPADVPFLPALATVPIQDDTPRGYKQPTLVVTKTTRKGPVRRETPKPDPKPVASLTGRIISVQVAGAGTVITIGLGKTTGASEGMHGKIKGVAATFTVASCNDRTCTASVAATLDQIKAADSVTLTP
jgi:hypothetical protein